RRPRQCLGSGAGLSVAGVAAIGVCVPASAPALAAHPGRRRPGDGRGRGHARAKEGCMTRLAGFLVQRTPLLLAGLILLLCVWLVPAFQRASYWLALAEQYFAPAALALALTPIILTGGIDLSVGSVSVLVSVVIGALWQGAGWPIEWAIAGGIL